VGALAIDHQSYTLDNGLEVLLSEDHDIPVVRVEVWYHVGSKNEVEGRSGFAHLFEHLMFQGSEHANADYFVPLQEIGASVNGSTGLDRTNYYEQLSSEYLPLALWMEADRMGWLLPVLDEPLVATASGSDSIDGTSGSEPVREASGADTGVGAGVGAW